jgi:hypothetical protein
MIEFVFKGDSKMQQNIDLVHWELKTMWSGMPIMSLTSLPLMKEPIKQS